MALPQRLESVHIDTLTVRDFTAPSGSVGNAAIEAGANISPTKLENIRCADVELFGQAVRVDAVNKMLHTVRGTSGQVLGFQAIQCTAATTTANLIFIDLQKATTSSTWASILTTALTMNSTDTTYVPRTATIASAGIASGNILRVSVTTTGGSTSNNAQGLLVSLHYCETPT